MQTAIPRRLCNHKASAYHVDCLNRYVLSTLNPAFRFFNNNTAHTTYYLQAKMTYTNPPENIVFTEEHVRLFNEQGFLALPGFLSNIDIEQAKERIQHYIDAWCPDDHPLIAFTTSIDNHIKDEYFLTSGDKIRYFLEEGALQNGQLVVAKNCAINKIGHALHVLDPVFKQLTFNPVIKKAATTLGLVDPLVVQSMAILKLQPPSALGFWIPLEDCTVDNGCLYFIPGSHKEYPITTRLVRNSKGGVEVLTENTTAPPIDDSRYVKVDCPAGTLVIIHGGVIHRSNANTSPHSRWAYTFHLVEGQATYSDKNWLQPTETLPFPKLL
ncbi:hypothetical protein BDF19DRAFT_440490 [Syncephalis fuscata]|nr:hypothetical protein BDF19DRAFT_440490 [Syncephalis fuscata]